MDLPILIGSILAASPPILFAVLGETITEKAGVINLSLDGSLLLTAMVGFVVALHMDSVIAGFLAGMVVGSLIAFILAFVSMTLYQPQVATGFVLTLLCRDLAYVFGKAYAHIPGPQVSHAAIPGFSDLPLIGPILFDQNPLVYLSLMAVILVWFFFFKTQPGLLLQGLGERPAAAYVRGVDVTAMRYLYTLIGGAIVGLGGASFSLMVKPGWARPYGIEGTGWIALAIVIFGGWHPIRAAVGALLFNALQTAANLLQSVMPDVPTQLFSTLPFPVMILTLLLVTIGNADWTKRVLNRLPEGMRRFLIRTLKALQTSPPASLGTIFKKE
ncbi:MAG: amino acid ABC transporter permease [Deltaproteobacteria bacterium RBG_16_49_23]|nr:MAG: amino acid ABC transporter permease [Deltaproteobacteria bacterium RBG_16_49_23]